MKLVLRLVVLLLSSSAARADSFFFATAAYGFPGPACNQISQTGSVNCASGDGVFDRVLTSASRIPGGFSFSESFDMGLDYVQAFGNLDLRSFTLASSPIFQGGPYPYGFANVTVLEQGSCTSNIADACDGFGYAFTPAPAQPTNAFTYSQQTLVKTYQLADPFPYPYTVAVLLNRTVAPNEHTKITGSVQIQSITFWPTQGSPVPEPGSGGTVWTGVMAGCAVLWRRNRAGRKRQPKKT